LRSSKKQPNILKIISKDMNIFPPPDQRLYPFGFYAEMRRLNPVAYDEHHKLWGVFRYSEYHYAMSIVGDYTTYSSAPQKLDSQSTKKT
jgi:hypothetical protein